MPRCLLALVLLAGPAAAQPGSASYTVTFESTWSAETHPADFPPNAHFSRLVGATHGAGASLWSPGGLPSPGIEQMAETGGISLLNTEVDALIAAGQADAPLNGGGIPVSPGEAALSFEIAPDFPLVSLVTMVAPSPDWFIGVSGLSLLENGAWAETLSVVLYAYDAGTDSGTTYTSPDADTQPREPITPIAGYPFEVEGEVRPLGTFTFVYNGIASNQDDGAGAEPAALSAPVPNPARLSASLALRVSTSQHVRVEAFDALGRRVALLHDGPLAAGVEHRVTFAGSGLPSGLYVVRATGETFDLSRRVALVR